MNKIIIAIITVIMFFVGAYVTGHLLIAKTQSLNYKVFWKSSIWKCDTEKALKKGEYILFEFAPDVYYVKRVACMPGQSLQVLEGIWFCGSKKIKDGVSITHSKATGKKLQQFDFYGIIPENKYFVIGDSQDSFDSRYWGFVDAENILHTLKPIW